MGGSRRWVPLALVVLAGCPEADIRPRDGGSDASVVDAGSPRDAGLDGSRPDAATPDAGVIAANVVFVTSALVAPGALGGLEGADALCNDLARDADLPAVGTYVAWLSTTSRGALERLLDSRGWVRPDGAPFADGSDDLMAGRIWAPPSLDETGAGAARAVVTATSVIGALLGPTCGDWASTGGDVRAGRSTDGTRRWTSVGDQGCGVPASIYCFGTGRVVPVEPLATTGRLVFRSPDGVPGDVGRAAMDAQCARDATDAGFPGRSFAAFVSTSSEAALERLTEGEPWVRPDGVLVARTLEDLSDQALLAPITPSADLTSYGDELVWVGSAEPGVRSAADEDCAGWSDDRATGRRGAAGSALGFFTGSNGSCATPHDFLCFER